ncbi:gluconeogenesis factor YvcK family protein [Mobilicoccus caccae]|uniref:Putative gluconeogenesis factor n=1 Tax=Mobilicoccus caccae TaxID=1859295 RepID=A0ABQ6IQX1_9MICO|nr:uridine diphosphate-N-acetylglucosamine-binding protein YvcK [Mobilicoccus caccae]GMA39481.1 putative gluconeogenesis factor [Mobilicoccus caccae]
MRRHVVAFGGGHGLAASLSALRLVTEHVTAIVTVADDGGSSGRLRREYDVLPPGDLRMALAALCDDSEWGHLWRDVLQHRFGGGGELAGHALGNLLIVGLWDLLGDTVGGLDLVGRLLGARGRVLPMAAVPLTITAEVEGVDAAFPDAVTHVQGQAAVATTPGRVLSVRLDPSEPPASPEALTAVAEADWVVLGPGSWYTSVMPHLLVPQLEQALRDTPALRILTLNLEMHTSETQGYSAVQHLESLRAHAPDVNIDVVLADPQVVDDHDDLSMHARRLGAELVVLPVARPDDPGKHDPLRLAAAYRDIIG